MYLVKNTDMPQVTDKLFHIIVYPGIEDTSTLTGLKFTRLVVICTDSIGSCISNYHIITTMIIAHNFYVIKGHNSNKVF